jgi:hypothetical protein
MIARLLTPAIVLASFAVALAVTGGHAGQGPALAAAVPAIRQAPPAPPLAVVDPDPAPPPRAPPERPVATSTATSAATSAATAAATAVDEAAAADDTPAVETAADLAKESEGFLDARDRAADHGARSH